MMYVTIIRQIHVYNSHKTTLTVPIAILADLAEIKDERKQMPRESADLDLAAMR